MISTLNFTVSPPSLSLVSQTASGTSPSWLLANPTNSSILYATDETDNGALNSLVLDHSTGKVTPVASIPTQGGSPTHIGLVNNGTQLGVANYGGGSAFFTTLEDDQLHFSNPQLLKFDQVPASNAHQVFFLM
jgi:6-phosphogluconolactonase (cycloisomerase 2 family)